MFTAADIVEAGTDGGDDDEEGESEHEDEEGEKGGVKERNIKYGDKNWWKQDAQDLPHLTLMDKQCLDVTATSASP